MTEFPNLPPEQPATLLCPLCKRLLGGIKISKHHLTPKSRGGKHGDIVMMHNICHQKIHSVFSEKELLVSYNTIDKLLQHEEMQKFVNWVANKAPGFFQRNRYTAKRRADRKQKRR